MTSPSGTGAPPSPAFPALNGEIPFLLEVEGCPVYAVYHPARREGRATAVLMAPGLGVEQLTGYRNEVLLARELAGRGIASLRFHPRGQGDSGGDDADLTLDSLAADVRAIAAELRRRTGRARLAAVGTRFGALALGRALRDGEALAALALWEPVERPADYFRGLLRGVLYSQVVQTAPRKRSMEEMTATLEGEGRVDVHGYALHRALVRSAPQDLATLLAEWKGPTLLVQIDARRSLAPAHAALAESRRARDERIEVREVREDVAWSFLQNPAWENAEIVRFTADWIDALD